MPTVESSRNVYSGPSFSYNSLRNQNRPVKVGSLNLEDEFRNKSILLSKQNIISGITSNKNVEDININCFKKGEKLNGKSRPHTFNPFNTKSNPPEGCGFIPANFVIFDNRTKFFIASNEEERQYDINVLKKVFVPPNTTEYIKKQKQSKFHMSKVIDTTMYKSTYYPISLLLEYKNSKQRIDLILCS